MGTTRRGFFKALAGLLAGGAIGGRGAREAAATATTINDGGQAWAVNRWQGETILTVGAPFADGRYRRPRVYVSNSPHTGASCVVTFSPVETGHVDLREL